MEYEITAQRQAYLDARGYTILTACPGSGKSTSIVKKLYSISEYCKTEYGSQAGCACLSFTNKACGELKEKYQMMHNEAVGFPHIVSTIDSFIMQYVVLPFWYLCDLCKSRPIVVNDEESMQKVYKVRTMIGGILHEYIAMPFRQYRDIFHKKTPARIERRIKEYVFGKKVITDTREKAYCEAAFLYRLQRGFVTSADAMWMACEILSNHKDIAKAIVHRFPYVIVDEAQDCSELQFYFFSLMKNAGLQNLEFVGDICQAIYEYRDARPDYLQKLMSSENTGWKTLPLTECRRSNQRIIDFYSLLKSADIPAIRSHQVEDRGIPIYVYLYNDENQRDVIRHFQKTCDEKHLGKRLVLARGRDLCKELAGIKNTEFKFWMTPFPNLLITAKFCFDNSEMDVAFRKARVALSEVLYGLDHNKQKAFIQSIEHDAEYNARIYTLLEDMPPFSLSFDDWTESMGNILKDFCQLPDVPNFKPRKKGVNGVKITALRGMPVEQFYMSNDKNSNYHGSIETIHSAKGCTSDGVLLFLSKNGQGSTISLKDFPDKPQQKMTEKQRMIYVACSRATQFLALAVPSTVNEQTIASKLKGVQYELKKINLQAELRLV